MSLQEICLRESEVVLCGGSESMSQAPYAVRNIRFGTKFGFDLKVGYNFLFFLYSPNTWPYCSWSNVKCKTPETFDSRINPLLMSAWQLEDTLWAGLTDLHIKIPMGITAENLAEKYQITREDCDNYAHQTQQRWKAGKMGFIQLKHSKKYCLRQAKWLQSNHIIFFCLQLMRLVTTQQKLLPLMWKLERAKCPWRRTNTLVHRPHWNRWPNWLLSSRREGLSLLPMPRWVCVCGADSFSWKPRNISLVVKGVFDVW